MSVGPKTGKVRVMKASTQLKAKVGFISVQESSVEKAQSVIENNTVDFIPMAGLYLAALDAAIERASTGDPANPDLKLGMVVPVMELKANATVFGYALIGRLATVMLDFLETIPTLDSTVIAIVDAHRKTLSAIISNRLSGDGGPYGQALLSELLQACDRYAVKKGIKKTQP
jgi:hypothetical protein